MLVEEGTADMRFWIDVRLATDGGESVKRRRMAGDISSERFDELCDELTGCVGSCDVDYQIEEDKVRVGIGVPITAE